MDITLTLVQLHVLNVPLALTVITTYHQRLAYLVNIVQQAYLPLLHVA